jgi:hypothetical protein
VNAVQDGVHGWECRWLRSGGSFACMLGCGMDLWSMPGLSAIVMGYCPTCQAHLLLCVQGTVVVLLWNAPFSIAAAVYLFDSSAKHAHGWMHMPYSAGSPV